MNHMHIQWARSILENKGYQVPSNAPDVIQDNPWSTVYRFKTKQGYIFLKKIPPALSLEANIIKLLHSKFHANVPTIIADNPEFNCFLINDAGIQLHQYFKQHFNTEIFIKTMQAYAELQISVTTNTQQFFDLGVPDWRLEKIPSLYDDFIKQESLLLEDGLIKADLLKLKKLKLRLVFLCERLAAYNIKDT